MTDWLLLLASVALVATCGLFVAVEFALITVDRATVERRAAAGDVKSRGVLAALKSLSTQLSGAQLGITITNLAIGFLAEQAIARLIDAPLKSAGLPAGAVSEVAVTIALVVATAATMIYGELVPKNLAIARPLQTARAVQGCQRAFTAAAAWPIRVLNGAANFVLRRFGIEPQEELATARSVEELFSLVGRSAEKGTLPHDTADLLQRSLAFGDKRAGDVITPRVRMRVIDVSAPVSEIIALTRRTGYSRFPVTGADLDDIVGAVHVKHAVAIPSERRHDVSVRDVMVPVELVPSSFHLDPLLESMRRGGLQMALVVDEYGGIDGLVTIEDLIEELVGDVRDEHDRGGFSAQPRTDGSWLLSGQLRPDEVTAVTGAWLPEDRAYDTVGGLIAKSLGRIPATGDEVEIGRVRLTVEHMIGLRVERVVLEPFERGSPEGRTKRV